MKIVAENCKRCRICNAVKPAEDFYAAPRNIDGLHSYCKSCSREKSRIRMKDPEKRLRQSEHWRAWAKKNSHRMPQYRRAMWEKHKHKYCKYQREAYKNPAVKAKRKLQRLVRTAVSNGYIAKPSRCCVCNKKNERIEAHHQNYNDPYRVDWLCPACHKLIHAVVNELVKIAA